MQQSSTGSSRGYWIALGATLLWSFTGILISDLSRTYALPSLVLAFWRNIFVSLLLLIVFVFLSPARFKLDRRHFVFMTLYGLILALFNSMWTFSVQYNGAAVATVLAFSSPAMTAILGRWILKEGVNTVKLISIALSLIGTLLVSGALDAAAWRVNAAGIAFGLLTGFFFACYNMFGKAASNRSLDSWTSLFYSFSSATLFLFLFNLIANLSGGEALLDNFLWLGNSTSGWGILLFLSLGPTLVGFGLYTMSLDYLPATVANLIATLEPALTAIWAYFLLGEQMNVVQWSGSLLLFTGIILLRLGEKPRPAASMV